MPSERSRTAEEMNRTEKSPDERLIDCCSGWLDADEAPVTTTVGEFHYAGDESEERVVLALANVFAGLMARAALADKNRASVDELSAEALYAQPLSV
jgi:hypothetical protein